MIDKTRRENTFCIVLGDFNLDLPLKLDSLPDAENVLNRDCCILIAGTLEHV